LDVQEALIGLGALATVVGGGWLLVKRGTPQQRLYAELVRACRDEIRAQRRIAKLSADLVASLTARDGRSLYTAEECARRGRSAAERNAVGEEF
jgi:hypothetical protein